VKRRLLATISIVLFVTGIVTLNLNSAVWAKDYHNTDSKNTFRHSEMINGKVNTMTNDKGNTQTNDNGNTQTNDNGNTQTNDNGNTQTSNLRSFNCDPEPECRKTFNNVMDMLGNLPKATTP
jgi:hypothetical protein